MRKPTAFGAIPFGAAARVAMLGLGLLCASAAHADDPKDPSMRSRAAREADRETIRRMNEDQLAMVRERDARYASGWRAWDSAHGQADADLRPRDADYQARSDSDEGRYAQARREYDAAMARWREDVAACQDGYYERCAR